MRIATFAEARRAFAADRPQLEARGIIMPQVRAYLSDDIRLSPEVAMDAQVALATTPSGGVPALLTTLIDPEVYDVLFAPLKAAEILGERKRGTWLDMVQYFPTVETVGEVSSYDDYSNNGMSNANLNWPTRQSYLFQTIIDYGERQIEMAALGNVNWTGELNSSAARNMATFRNLSYFYGIASLENYGLFNSPGLSAPITPGTKTAGGVAWFDNGVPNATANEVYDDIVAVVTELVSQSNGLVDKDSKMKLCFSPGSAMALQFTNEFNVNVEDLLKKNFPNLKVVTAVQYGEQSTTNPQGYLGGNFMQLIAETVEGQQTGYPAYNEMFRSHNIVQGLSSWKQKFSGGTWGFIIRNPWAITSMVGI